MMKYVLVLQFPASILTFDEVIKLEDSLIKELEGIAFVDGHDLGSGELNYFIFLNDVSIVFDKIRAVLKAEELKNLKAAFRPREGENYHILYPSNLCEFKVS
jgi:hypothetical protein